MAQQRRRGPRDRELPMKKQAARSPSFCSAATLSVRPQSLRGSPSQRRGPRGEGGAPLPYQPRSRCLRSSPPQRESAWRRGGLQRSELSGRGVPFRPGGAHPAAASPRSLTRGRIAAGHVGARARAVRWVWRLFLTSQLTPVVSRPVHVLTLAASAPTLAACAPLVAPSAAATPPAPDAA